MHVLVFATEKATGSSSPFVAILDRAQSALPRHPNGLQWTYFATMASEDAMLRGASASLLKELHDNGHFIWHFPMLKSLPRTAAPRSGLKRGAEASN